MRQRRVTLYAVLFYVAVQVLVKRKLDSITNADGVSIQDGVSLRATSGGVTKNVVKRSLKKPLHQYGSAKKSYKTILWYDIFHDGHGLRNKADKVDFSKCSYKQCVLLKHQIVEATTDVNEGPPVEADAVIFQGAHLWNMSPPRRRNSDQVFVFAERESWMFYGSDIEFEANKYTNRFNWTMTYRSDSDIFMPYGQIRESQRMKNTKKNIYKIFSEKEKFAIWIVSNCASKSLREDYIAELQKYINVDIIGDCGNSSVVCPKQKSKSCLSKVEKEYKFILSFENSFHKDYVTEKLFSWFNKDIIQVVYGLANYSSIVPKGTVIDSARFKSPLELAQVMTSIGNNEKRYIKHLRKKERYKSEGLNEMQQRAYCKLCEMLHNKNKYRKVYPHIGQWWGINSTQGVNPFVASRVEQLGQMIKTAHNATDRYIKVLKEKHLV